MRSEKGFTLLEMLFVLGIASILMGVFALPASLRDHGSAIRMESVRALAEYAQCEAAAEGSQVSVRFQGDLVSSDTMRLRLPEGMSCTPHTIRFYPQLSASPAMSVRFGTGEGRTLVFQLGSGRSDVR